MPGRKYSIANTKYRYGFNGKENDNEVKGEGNEQDYGARIYDPRIVKFLSIDPIATNYPMLTPYQFASNRPIDGIDLDGKEWSISSVSKYRGSTLIKKTNEFVVKLNVVNHTTLSDAALKDQLGVIKFGAERILQNNFITRDKQLEINNTVTIEYVFNEKPNLNEGFTLDIFNVIPQDYSDRMSNTLTLAKTKEIGNTQTNTITFAINQEINLNGATVSNSLDRQSKNLAEEILHTGSLGHTGINFVGDRPDEKDADINAFTPVLDPQTNVMVQRGKSGMQSTTNVIQFQKVEKKVLSDLGKEKPQ